MRHHAKQQGTFAEVAFCARALRLGFIVALPLGADAPFDVVLGAARRRRLLRVQVRSVSVPAADGAYYISTGHGRAVPLRRYTLAHIDFFAVHLIPADAWYIIPVDALGGVTGIRLNPRSPRGRWTRWREAWHLFGPPPNTFTVSDSRRTVIFPHRRRYKPGPARRARMRSVGETEEAWSRNVGEIPVRQS